MRRTQVSAVLGAVFGALVVVTVMVSAHPGWGIFTHTECHLNQRVGNITVWFPAAVIAAPYHGSESGSVTIWGKSPLGESVLTQDTSVTDGNVTAFYVDFVNFTVFSRDNASAYGPGPEAPCSSSIVGYFSSSPAVGLRSGGTTFWPLDTELASDRGLPTGLNGSQLCSAVENSSYGSCAVGAQFDLNFEVDSGTVDTCGVNQNQVLRLMSDGWSVLAPFQLNNQSYAVPLDPSGSNTVNYANGTYAFYNYTFPANGGIWQYDNLSQTSNTGAGLVFSYSPCP
jgi:hypothetical protein